MSDPYVLRLYDREEPEPMAPSPLVRRLPSGVGTVRGDPGGNIVAVDLEPRRLQTVDPAVLTAELLSAIQQLQLRAVHRRRARRR
jgi:hypothetical protein